MIGGVRRLLHRLAAPFRHGGADREVQEELAAHLAMAAEDYERQGCSRGGAGSLNG